MSSADREAVEQAIAEAEDDWCTATYDESLHTPDEWQRFRIAALLDAALAAGCLLPDQLEQITDEQMVAVSDVTGELAWCNPDGMWQPVYRILRGAPDA